VLLYRNRDLFMSDLSQLPGTNLVTHTTDTGSGKPIRQRPFWHSLEVWKEIDRQIDLMLKADIIEESDSPWGSPVVLIRKKNNSHRLCIDMRKLNSVTKPVFFPLPLLEDVFQTVAENNPCIFSTLAMSSGFYQIHLHKDSKPKTASVTHWGNYQFKGLPFGVSGVPASYQHLMVKVLRNTFSYALCYVDDILCMSDSPERHCEHLAEIFDRFHQAKLRLNPSKCKFALPKITYLGHMLSISGYQWMIRRYQPFETTWFPKIAHSSVASSASQITTILSLSISPLKLPIYAVLWNEMWSLFGTPPTRPSSTFSKTHWPKHQYSPSQTCSETLF